MTSTIGYLFGLLFCVATALSSTMIHATTTHLDPFFSLSCTTIIGIIYFNVVNIKNIKNIYRVSYGEKYLWLMISICVAGNWLMAFYALSLVNPFDYIFTYFSSSAIIGLVVNIQKYKKINDFLSAGVLLLLLIFYVIYTNENVLGLVIAAISAAFGYSYRRYSVKFSRRTLLTATSVLAIRFYLLLIISLIFSRHPMISTALFFNFISLTTLTFLMPLYFMQKSVLLIGAEYFSILTACCPFMTALLLFLINHHYQQMDFLLAALLCGVITANKWYGRVTVRLTARSI